MDYKKFFEKRNIEYQEGLNEKEISHIEEIYDIFFPTELKEVLEQVLPVEKGFYNWRDFSKENIQYIIQTIERSNIDFFRDAADIYWNDDWGKEPKNNEEIEKIVRNKLSHAPKLIPIYTHRYMPMIDEKNNPIFSIHGVDVICYGTRIDEYFQIEFGEKKQESIKYSEIKQIPFWTEMI